MEGQAAMTAEMLVSQEQQAGGGEGGVDGGGGGGNALRGEGREIIATLPIQARISARDVGGLLKGETATGAARVQARITIDLDRDWQPRGTVKLTSLSACLPPL
jgi:hypothetical protein